MTKKWGFLILRGLQKSKLESKLFGPTIAPFLKPIQSHFKRVGLKPLKGYISPMPQPPKTKVTIEMAIMSFETDYQGIVNNTEFIRFLERVRYALSKKLGFSFKQVRNAKLWTVMARVEINYYTPGRFEDIMLGTG